MADFSDLGFMQRGRLLFVGFVMLFLGGVVGYVLPHTNASPSSQRGSVVSVGNAAPNAGLRFEFKPVKGAREKFILQPATPWRKSRTSDWTNKGEPSCLVPGSVTPTPATIGVVDISSTGSAPGRSVVVWVECYR